jgi:hypothetical protein
VASPLRDRSFNRCIRGAAAAKPTCRGRGGVALHQSAILRPDDKSDRFTSGAAAARERRGAADDPRGSVRDLGRCVLGDVSE